MRTNGTPPCPLCGDEQALPLGRVLERDYFECAACGLSFMDPAHRPTRDAELARYETHENDPADGRYRAFLSRLFDPLVERLEPGAAGLDYGSGPGPALAAMLNAAGFPTAIYDPFYAPDRTVLARTYDFVTCTETAEHFFDPGAEFERIDALLRPGGWLGVMTTMRADEPFRDWWYVRDPTHVVFYRPRTMEWIARRHGWTMQRHAQNVVLFRKGST